MNGRLHDINALYDAVQQDNAELARLLHDLLKPGRSVRGYDAERAALIALCTRMTGNINLITGKTLEYDKRLKRGKVRAAA